jgi:hypothetical protein
MNSTVQGSGKSASLLISVSNVAAGQGFTLTLSTSDAGQSIQFSSGSDQHSNGISLNSSTAGAAIPLTSISIQPQTIAVATASGGAPSVSFALALYVTPSAGLNSFVLTTFATLSGANVTASMNNEKAQLINDAGTIFLINQ